MKNLLHLKSEVRFDNRHAAMTFASGATTDFNFVANPDAGIKMTNLPYIPSSTNTQATFKEAKRIF